MYNTISIVNGSPSEFFKVRKVHSQTLKISLEYLDGLFKMRKIELFCKSFEGFDDVVVFNFRDAHYDVLARLLLGFQKGLLSSVHSVNNVNVFTHRILEPFHTL